MSVAVISSTGKILMPTSEYRARKLLAAKKAVRYSYNPFTIQPHDIVVYNGRKYKVQGCITYGKYAVLMPGKINVPVGRLTILKHSGGYAGIHLTA